MKKFVVWLLLALFLIAIFLSPVQAASYEYIIDDANLFDDSTDMISMAKEIRNKLDFDIHIYSVSTLANTEEIVEQYVQNSSALLIFVSSEQEMNWWAGSNVQRTIRDIDFENLFASVQVTNKQYSQAVNSILSSILSIYVYGEEPAKTHSEPHNGFGSQGREEVQEAPEESWLVMNFNYCIHYIETHPVRIFLGLVSLVAIIIYYSRRKRNSLDDYIDDSTRE